MIQELPGITHKLGWIRVAVRLAAQGQVPNGSLLGKWLRENSVSEPSPGEGSVSAPAEAARVLGFLNQALGLTDQGNVLLWAEHLTNSSTSDPFEHSLAVRWILWNGSATAEPEWWRAALSSWKPKIKAFQWLEATVRRLEKEGRAGRLVTVLEAGADARQRGGLAVRHGTPRFGQLEHLRWTESLLRLQNWALQSPDPWTSESIWQAFVVAEGLSEAPPADIESLRELLTEMPDALLVPGRLETDAGTVQLSGAARSLALGQPQHWYGAAWETLLTEARAAGFSLKAGRHAQHPNLAWSAESLEPVPAADPAPPLVELPPDAPPPLPPPVTPEDERARSWLRAVAWWLTGPTAGDLIALGHDSWQLLHWTLEHWLAENQKDHWDKRVHPISQGGQSKVDWFAEFLGRFNAPGRTALEMISAPKEVAMEVRRAAFRRLSGRVDPPRAFFEQYLAAGTGWADLEWATRIWLSGNCEQREWMRDHLRAGLQGIGMGTAGEARRLLEAMADRHDWKGPLRVQGRMVVRGEPAPGELPLGWVLRRDSMEDLPVTEGGPREPDGRPFEVLAGLGFAVIEFEVETQGGPAAETIRRGLLQGRDTVLAHAPSLSILLLDQPLAVWDQDDQPVLWEPRNHADAAGMGTWWSPPGHDPGVWLADRLPPPPGFAIGREADEFGRSRRNESVAERLLGLWVTLEHPFGEGASGGPVIEQLAQAAVPAVFQALRRDIVEIATRLGETPPGPEVNWTDWAAWDWMPTCTWAQSRVDLLRNALNNLTDFKKLRERAAASAAWLLRAVFSVRNRRVHEAFQARVEDELILEHLNRGGCVLVEALLRTRVDHQWTALGPLIVGLERDWKKTPAALLDELRVLP